MPQHRVVSENEWLAARLRHLAKEKQLTRLRDELARERRELPWVRVEKQYVFDTTAGRKGLADLFEARTQLIVQHFMFGPGWKDGCVGCSFSADGVDSARMHFEHNDVSFVAVARAPLAELEAFRKRMGWEFRWASAHGSDFNYDFHVSFTKDDLSKGKVYYNYEPREINMEDLPGLSVFCKDESGAVYHTYSTYARGGEPMLTAYHYLDMTPKGRNETGPTRGLTDWVRLHDCYDAGGPVDRNGHYIAPEDSTDCCSER